MFVIWNPHELYDSDELYMRENVSVDEMRDIERLVLVTAWHIAHASSK